MTETTNTIHFERAVDMRAAIEATDADAVTGLRVNGWDAKSRRAAAYLLAAAIETVGCPAAWTVHVAPADGVVWIASTEATKVDAWERNNMLRHAARVAAGVRLDVAVAP